MLENVCSITGFGPDVLQGPSRKRPVVRARQLVLYLLIDYCKLDYTAASRFMKHGEHTYARYGYFKFRELLDSDKSAVTSLIKFNEVAA